MTLGERIKSLRQYKKITLREFSKKIGISISFLSDIENSRSKPSLERLKDIAEGLGVAVSYLLGEEEETVESNNFYAFTSTENKYRDINGVKEDSIYISKKDLPSKALKEIEEYIEFIRYKYKKDKNW